MKIEYFSDGAPFFKQSTTVQNPGLPANIDDPLNPTWFDTENSPDVVNLHQVFHYFKKTLKMYRDKDNPQLPNYIKYQCNLRIYFKTLIRRCFKLVFN